MISIEEATKLMKEKHAGQLRKHGTPYYTHPLAVANILKEKGFNEEYQIAGLFHDMLEDTDTTYEEILSLSNERVAEAVKLVTKEKGYNEEEYISRIEENEMAKMVKLADRMNNLQELKYTNKDFIEKYLLETKKYFIKLAKDTLFEKDICDIIKQIEEEN